MEYTKQFQTSNSQLRYTNSFHYSTVDTELPQQNQKKKKFSPISNAMSMSGVGVRSVASMLSSSSACARPRLRDLQHKQENIANIPQQLKNTVLQTHNTLQTVISIA